MRAIVIGGSVGGLFAGCLLHKAGCEVTVYERALGDLAGRGAGLGISAELVEVMTRAGAAFDARSGVAQREHLWMERSGEIVFRHPRNLMASAWARVYQPLRAALPAASYRQGMSLARIEQDGDGVLALFADGTRASADLLVAADGAHSTARRQYLPDTEPRYANYVAWRGLVESGALPPATLAALTDRLVFCFPPDEMLLAMRVPDGAYFIWYRHVPEGRVADLFTDASGKSHGLSIPPPLIRAELLQELKHHAREALPAPIAPLIQACAQPLLQAISDMEAPRLCFDRVALLGDAAFVVRPHVAGGASKAALDARTLVDALVAESTVNAALERYERAQLDFGRRIVQHSRYLGADLEGRRTARDPARIIRDYGAPHLLHDVT
jgi:2-polyprenyl-6-methoxyphenol hydroxylase-like FAD-dependent oxidoreductase